MPTETPQTTENIEAFLKALENPREQLTRWELDFLVSVRDQFDRRGHLNHKQFQILAGIVQERT